MHYNYNYMFSYNSHQYGNNIEKIYYDTKYDACLMPTLNGKDMYQYK